MLVYSKKHFILPSVWSETEYTWTLIWKKSLLICFESYQSIPYSHTGRVDRECTVKTLLIGNLTLYVRASLKDKSMLFIHFYLM